MTDRHITTHNAVGETPTLELTAIDEPGPGGANHEYCVIPVEPPDVGGFGCTLEFQCGPIAEVGVNGLSNEVLLAIVLDRLEAFQAGPFACQENGLALTSIRHGLHWLHVRTENRLARGVEGKSEA